MEIRVTIKDQYGREAIHPACSTSRTFADIAGTKTLTRDTLALIKRLGYEVKVERAEWSL